MANEQSPNPELEALLHEAKALENKRDSAAAGQLYLNILKQYPNDTTACYEFGIFLNHNGQFTLAKNYLANVIRHQPENAEAWLGLGVSLQELKSDIEAEKCYRHAITLNPNLAAAHANLGILYRNKGLYTEAIQYYEHALSLDPGLATVYVGLANALSLIGDNEHAIETLKKVIAISPSYAKAYNSLGMILQLTHRYEEALLCYQKALSLAPNSADIQFNLGFYYLQHGDFKQGLPKYEARWQLPTANPIRKQFTYPRWNGESLEKKTLLIFTEQGYGDVINFCRYIPLINKSDGKIFLNCDAELVSLMKSLSNVDEIIIRNQDSNPVVDYYIPLQSLPLVFGTTMETIPANVPYLQTEPDKKEYWRDFFANQPSTLKVGICWRGRPNLLNSINRTCGLNHFLPFFVLSNVSFYSLQKDPTTEEQASLSDIICLGDKMNDFSDTAAIIEQLDLIITVDTSIAHLAGALNKPVWNLLPYSADWRWFLDRSDTPWYPSMHLYRQSVYNDWLSVFTQVWQDLIKIAV